MLLAVMLLLFVFALIKLSSQLFYKSLLF